MHWTRTSDDHVEGEGHSFNFEIGLQLTLPEM